MSVHAVEKFSGLVCFVAAVLNLYVGYVIGGTGGRRLLLYGLVCVIVGAGLLEIARRTKLSLIESSWWHATIAAVAPIILIMLSVIYIDENGGTASVIYTLF